MRGEKKDLKLVKVVGVKVPEGKKQHLKINKTYEVTPEAEKALLKNGQAKKK